MKKVFCFVGLYLLLLVPVFSQTIIAQFGFGMIRGKVQNTDYSGSAYTTKMNLMSLNLNVLFINEIGLTVAAEINSQFEFGKSLLLENQIGLGYTYFDESGLYISFLPMFAPSLDRIWVEHGKSDSHGDMLFYPTIIVGYDFRALTVFGEVGYFTGITSPISGFRFIGGVGVKI